MMDYYSNYPAPSIEMGAEEIVISLSARLSLRNPKSISISMVRAYALSYLRQLGHERMGSYTGWYVHMKTEATNFVHQKLVTWPSRKRVLMIKLRFIGVLMSAYWRTLDKLFAPESRYFDACKLKYKHLIEPDKKNRILRSRSYDSLLDSTRWNTKLNYAKWCENMHQS